MTERLKAESREMNTPWNAVQAAFGGPIGVFAAFAAAHAALLLLGYSFKESIGDAAVMWPSAGLAFATLWLAPRRYWPVVLIIQFAVELAIGAALQRPFMIQYGALFALANCIDAAVGASVVLALIDDPGQVRTRQTLQFMLATATGAMAGALIGAWANTNPIYSPLSYLHQLQMWWASDWLGSLTFAPVVFCWISPIRSRIPELALRSRMELFALAAVLVLATLYVFSVRAGGAASIFQLPFILLVLMVYTAYQLPPRWAATLVAMTVCICAHEAAHRRGPFATADPFIRAVQVQAFLASMAALTFVLTVSTAEKRIVLGRLRESDYRYRSFVELNTEAVWRVELLQSMPLELPVEEQLQWLRTHARIVESSRSYQDLDPAAKKNGILTWRPEVPWCAMGESQLAVLAKSGFTADGMRFSMDIHGRRHSFVTAFVGVVDDARLLRIWGVARDITEIIDLNTRLLREQDRLKSYARQIGSAEEKARRATAVDLHDGIGQSLVGMAMTLEVASQHTTGDVRLLVDEVRSRLREVQERTRHMISDLSPPGLYDLGLGPALQWLAVYVRGHQRLHVELEVHVREDALPIEMRVLVFKLVRELLRNVVKHAGVQAARVAVHGDAERLHVEVSDQGRGFEWQMDMFGAASGGFGLWSIADRVHEAGGEFRVDTAPGRGSRFEMEFPLRRAVAESGRYWMRSTDGAA
ncbi:MAG TPA: MASE1 domain-containing protein [Steroidobacteraceae bacterium]|nr:MASE1 domain-containing protein [Steroidobacteraceae bacterium]